MYVEQNEFAMLPDLMFALSLIRVTDIQSLYLIINKVTNEDIVTSSRLIEQCH